MRTILVIATLRCALWCTPYAHMNRRRLRVRDLSSCFHVMQKAHLMIKRTLAFTLLTLTAAIAHAQAWPTKPIRFVVPFAPGGTSEIVARAVAQELSLTLGQSVFVENKPGGAGVIAMTEALKAEPDGHTLILGHVGTLAVNPFAMPKHPYDVNKEFAPVILLARVPSVLAVSPEVPAKTLQEFVALAKAKPDTLTYGSAGNGSSGHLAMEYFMAERDRKSVV